MTADEHNGFMPEILEARIRDPKTSARDLSALVNSLARLDGETGSGKSASNDDSYFMRLIQPGESNTVSKAEDGTVTWAFIDRPPGFAIREHVNKFVFDRHEEPSPGMSPTGDTEDHEASDV